MTLYSTVAILGGDTRQLALARFLAMQGFDVRTFGLPCTESPDVSCALYWQDALERARAVILPLPASADGKNVYMPLAQSTYVLPLTEVFEAVKGRVLLLGGKLSPAVKATAGEKGVRLIDYFENEELQEKNALPTAEGAVSVLMREVPRTVSGLSIGITGFGRVARALTRLLKAMGAKVTVIARKQRDVLLAQEWGCDAVQLTGAASLIDFANKQTVIFNTVPHWLFNEDVLAQMKRDGLIIDLASAPGGVDANAAAVQGIRVIWALSLPGKYAPVTAGEIIAATVVDIMKKEGAV